MLVSIVLMPHIVAYFPHTVKLGEWEMGDGAVRSGYCGECLGGWRGNFRQARAARSWSVLKSRVRKVILSRLAMCRDSIQSTMPSGKKPRKNSQPANETRRAEKATLAMAIMVASEKRRHAIS